MFLDPPPAQQKGFCIVYNGYIPVKNKIGEIPRKFSYPQFSNFQGICFKKFFGQGNREKENRIISTEFGKFLER